jgi:ABC-type nitrate/sulfonate/bicarbonate transport system substrate-binding protein
MKNQLRRRTAVVAGALAVVLVASCGSDNSSSSASTTASSAAASSSASTTASSNSSTAFSNPSGDISAAGISQERCAANKSAGTITYLSSFDFAAAASILDVVVAKDRGYFDDVCLDVTIKPSFSTSNYPLVASGQAQMSSAGSYTEMLNYSKNGAKFVAVADYGKTPIEALVVPDTSNVTTLQDLRGKTIGIKGDIPPSIVAMLSKAGLQRSHDYKEVLLDGFDPVAQLKTGIDALPVYKSNEPGQLDRAGVKYRMFDPADYSIPGSFGVIYTTPNFLSEHPTAVQDFVRAAFKGFADANADPAAAVALSIKEINAAGNQNFLTLAGETFRWQQESAIVARGAPSGQPPGLVDGDRLDAEVAAYAAANIFPDGAPSTSGTYAPDAAAGVYGPGGTLIWPARS